MSQLSLNIALLDGFDFASFYPLPENKDVLDLLQTSFWQTFPQVFLFGESGSGKSHLLQACCYQAQEQHDSAAYLSLRQLSAYGVKVLEGLDACALLAVDDLEVVMGDPEWEASLFHLINRCRQNKQPLLLAARENPHELPCLLPDLASRLLWGPIYRINKVEEVDALNAFKWRAHQRGFQITDYVVNYIGRHYARDIQSLMAVLDRLDAASLNKSRKITRNFIQEVLPMR